jgi:hypothetical protein
MGWSFTTHQANFLAPLPGTEEEEAPTSTISSHVNYAPAHTAIQITPLQALYGFSPPQISELSVLEPPELEATEFLQAKQDMLDKLKLNLQQATARMKKYADSK